MGNQILPMFQKLYRHLEEIKTTLNQDRPGMSNQVGETIIGQLESMNATLLQLQPRPPVRQMVLWTVSAAVILPLMLFMAFTLAQINRNMSNPAPALAIQAAPAGIPSKTDSTDAAEYRLAVQKHLATLDSLIGEQQQSLEELKKLNTTAVLTMQRIRRHFVVSDRMAKSPPTAVWHKF